jgi:ubiquinone/menaquinone biosynthesis C-methylase UbiE
VLTELGSGNGAVRVTDAAATGLPDASTDVVVGEAMLTMQGDAAKHAVVGEAARVLRPHGRYAIHELALTPDTVSADISTDIRQSLARAIKVNARPLTKVLPQRCASPKTCSAIATPASECSPCAARFASIVND